MILNCYTCGKSVSNRAHLCPYCKAEVVSLELGTNTPVGVPAAQRDKRRGLAGAILSLVLG
ncbi:MAG: hypothetical protein WC101_00050 [Candidatus Gracilibacteria bacterium]|nr:hypothetical protein [Candidatus Gracilibacteria bacterium]